MLAMLAMLLLVLIVIVQTSTERNGGSTNKSSKLREDIQKLRKPVEIKNEKELLHDDDGSLLQVIFSTDCSPYQEWQSYLLFHSALKAKQPGYITRIASGCSGPEAVQTANWHKKYISDQMSDRFRLHLTPHFSSVTASNGKTVDYKFFNKPFGLLHWMQYGEDMGIDERNKTPQDEDAIIILLDPDHLIVRPITSNFADTTQSITNEKDFINFPLKVSHGHPIAQKYGLGAGWKKFDLVNITGSSDSPALKISNAEANRHYPAGPPYLATAKDMYQIALKWTEFAPKVHAQYPYLLAEMYAFCVAAAHLELPHLMIESLMVSNSGAGGEGWPHIDKIRDPICQLDYLEDGKTYPQPNVLHFCQRYIVGKHFFAKRKMPKNIFSCESPYTSMVYPPIDLGEKFPFKYPLGSERKILESKGEELPKKDFANPKHARRDAYMICVLTTFMNDALSFFREKNCNVDAASETILDLALLP